MILRNEGKTYKQDIAYGKEPIFDRQPIVGWVRLTRREYTEWTDNPTHMDIEEAVELRLVLEYSQG